LFAFSFTSILFSVLLESVRVLLSFQFYFTFIRGVSQWQISKKRSGNLNHKAYHGPKCSSKTTNKPHWHGRLAAVNTVSASLFSLCKPRSLPIFIPTHPSSASSSPFPSSASPPSPTHRRKVRQSCSSTPYTTTASRTTPPRPKLVLQTSLSETTLKGKLTRRRGSSKIGRVMMMNSKWQWW
jgi:hypothetical protein